MCVDLPRSAVAEDALKAGLVVESHIRSGRCVSRRTQRAAEGTEIVGEQNTAGPCLGLHISAPYRSLVRGTEVRNKMLK